MASSLVEGAVYVASHSIRIPILLLFSCLTNACQNNGTCLEIAVESHNCICPPGFSGSQCEQKIDPCLAKPCKNGGTCTSSADGKNWLW